MKSKKEIGNQGEDLAARFLARKGFEILDRNYRFGRAEIDLIAKNKQTLVFVEVKWRSNLSFGYPFVSKEQQQRIMDAAEEYQYNKGWKGPIRFDIISIVSNKAGTSITHFEDALQ